MIIDSTGVLNQVAIVLGIFTAQLISLWLARPTLWRFIQLVSGSVALLQIILSSTALESPKWIKENAVPVPRNEDEESGM
jgi:MFS family permease